MQRNPHSYQIATGYRTFYSLSLIYQPITKKRLFFNKKKLAKKKWSELPNSVKVELLFEYEIPEEEMEKYWNGTDYIQREVYILKDLN